MRGLVWVLVAVAGWAQEPPSRDIGKLLRSKEPSDLAWGAYLAGDSGNKKWVPDMIRLLERKRVTAGDRKVPAYALDALIRLKADVPDDLLLAVAHDAFLPVAFLLQRDARKHLATVARLIDTARDDYQWLVLNSILRVHPTPEYTARVFREWTIEVKILVTDLVPRAAPTPGADAAIATDTSAFAAEFCSGGGRGHGIEDYVINGNKFPPEPENYPEAPAGCWNARQRQRDRQEFLEKDGGESPGSDAARGAGLRAGRRAGVARAGHAVCGAITCRAVGAEALAGGRSRAAHNRGQGIRLAGRPQCAPSGRSRERVE